MNAVIVDGRAIAARMLERTKEEVEILGRAPILSVITIDPVFATKNFLRIKSEKASELGVHINLITLEGASSTEVVAEKIKEACESSDGIILQLPFPAHIDTEALLELIPKEKDVDVIGIEADQLFKAGEVRVFPPVVAAIKAIGEEYKVSFRDKNVVVLGAGRLVGAPSAVWATQQGAQVTVATRETTDLSELTRAADILILGAGSPGVVRSDMIKEGVIIFDAGTSEEGGKLVGDADPSCIEKAGLITPVPGGIGPITIAVLFSNLLALTPQSKR